MNENQSTSKIPLAKRLVKEILEDWSEVSKDVVLRKRSWSAFHRWLRVWQKLLFPAELRIALFVADRTIGYGKSEDKISFKQFRDGVRKKDGTIIHLGSGVRKRENIREALKSLKEISFLDFEWKPGTLIEYRLITQETLPPKGTLPYPLKGQGSVLLGGRPTTERDITERDITKENLKNLNDETNDEASKRNIELLAQMKKELSEKLGWNP